MRKRWATAAVAATALVGVVYPQVAASANDANKANDVIFHDRDSRTGPDYIEVFKKEGTNGKNYLYTVTQVVTSGGEYCTVITFDSEQAGTATCRQRSDVANPDVYRPLKPELFPDRKAQ